MKCLRKMVVLIILLCSASFVYAGQVETVDIETLRSLKENMDTFFLGTTEIQKKLGNITSDDWPFIIKNLGEMHRNVLEMDLKDRKKVYHQYTDSLYEMIRNLKKLALKKDSKRFEASFDEMTDTCFRCHTTHRKPDIKPKRDHDVGSLKNTKARS